MKITVLTLFPEMFESFTAYSIINRALKNELVDFECVNFRDYAANKHHKVDDYTYGGGAGMVLAVQPLADCLKSVKEENSHVILLSPAGSTFNQAKARGLVNSNYDQIILICGHYEGFDARINNYIDETISIGDYILTGGEIGAMAISDALIRLVPGVIKAESNQNESFENGLLEAPQYTMPEEYDGYKVPEVLLSGHHENIRKWRLEQSLKLTLEMRPDLLDKKELNKEEKEILSKLISGKDDKE